MGSESYEPPICGPRFASARIAQPSAALPKGRAAWARQREAGIVPHQTAAPGRSLERKHSEKHILQRLLVEPRSRCRGPGVRQLRRANPAERRQSRWRRLRRHLAARRWTESVRQLILYQRKLVLTNAIVRHQRNSHRAQRCCTSCNRARSRPGIAPTRDRNVLAFCPGP